MPQVNLRVYGRVVASTHATMLPAHRADAVFDSRNQIGRINRFPGNARTRVRFFVSRFVR